MSIRRDTLRAGVLVFTACMVFLAASGLLVAGTASKPSAKVVMVVLPAVSLEDLTSTNLPNIRKIMNTGAIGLMNSRTAGRPDDDESAYMDPKYAPESGYVTLGAGARAMAGVDARKAFCLREMIGKETAAAVLKQRTLVDPKSSAVVHIGIAKLIRDNSTLNYEINIGLLGAALHKAGVKTAVIGNSDDVIKHREIASICMDGNGLVDYGDVRRMDDSLMLSEAARCIRQADFTVIELGDSARLDRMRLDLTDEVFQRKRIEYLKQSDQVLGRILALADQANARVIILSPYASSYVLEQNGSTLCPVLIAGRQERGLLTSGSTKIPGVITNTDLAPSIMAWMGISAPPTLVGRKISSVSHPSPIYSLQSLNERVAMQNASMPVLRQAAVVTIILVGIITALWLLLADDYLLRRRLFPFAILIPSSLAPAMLVAAWFPTGSQFGMWIRLAAASIIITGSALAIGRKPLRALALIGISFAALISADLVTGGSLCRFSIMGYSIMDGSRYYGIGNELMGALIGAIMVSIPLLFGAPRFSRRALQISLLVGLLLGTVVIGAPVLGANTGGAIAVLAAFGLALASTSKKPINPARIALMMVSIAAVLALFAILDSIRSPEHQSHLGKAVRLAESGGLSDIGLLIKRKLAMNLLLIRVSVWTKLLAAYVISIMAVLQLGGSAKHITPLSPEHRIALVGVVGGTLTALVFNDSGIVAAATCFVYAWALLLLTALEAKPPSK